jgi:hypothetical protein
MTHHGEILKIHNHLVPVFQVLGLSQVQEEDKGCLFKCRIVSSKEGYTLI